VSAPFLAPLPAEADPQIIETLTLDDVRITAILDAESRMSMASLFERASPPIPVADLPSRYPREFTGTAWRFRIRCFLVSAPDGLALIDAGAGPADGYLGGLLGVEGRLLSALASLGVEPGQIQHVVLTHLHDDHVGWATSSQGAGYQPTFPRATYHLHPADLAFARDLAGSPGRYWEQTFEPLLRSGQLSLSLDAHELWERFTLVDSPGHTPGHRCGLLAATGADVLFTGDLLHFGFQVERADAAGPFDRVLGGGNAARERLLRARHGRRLILASAHLPDAFTTLGASAEQA
jgi:glyoxylase-like metal-dependent hydrolase (beta-lactamase superfamily II)